MGSYGIYLIFTLPALLLGLWAQGKVKSAFAKYSRIRSGSGVTGREIARRMLTNNGVMDVEVEQTRGMLSDHYDPAKKVLRLSPDIYNGNSIAAAGVAAHEAGHAIQHAHGSLMLQVRTAMVPTVQFGSWVGPILFIIGLMLNTRFGSNLAVV
jgi:Zn-dependent membrane protease YugP